MIFLRPKCFCCLNLTTHNSGCGPQSLVSKPWVLYSHQSAEPSPGNLRAIQKCNISLTWTNIASVDPRSNCSFLQNAIAKTNERYINVFSISMRLYFINSISLFPQQLNLFIYCMTAFIMHEYHHLWKNSFSPQLFEHTGPKLYNPTTSQPRQGPKQKNQQRILYSYISVHPLSRSIIHRHSLSLWLGQIDCQPFLSPTQVPLDGGNYSS